MPSPIDAEFESALREDLAAIAGGGFLHLSEDDLSEALRDPALTYDTMLDIARHPNVPEWWVMTVIEGPREVGLEDRLATDVHFALAENHRLPPMLLSLLLAENLDGTLDDTLVGNPKLPGRALTSIVRRHVPEPKQWRELCYSYDLLLAAYSHPNLTDDCGRFLTAVMLGIWGDGLPSEDDDTYFIVVRDVVPGILSALASSSVDPSREGWFTSEERSTLLVHHASR